MLNKGTMILLLPMMLIPYVLLCDDIEHTKGSELAIKLYLAKITF